MSNGRGGVTILGIFVVELALRNGVISIRDLDA